MYTATFIFAKKQYDEDFHLLDGRIAEAARALPGYLGEESWEDPARGLISNVYYWESLDALQALIRHPLHQQAKAAQSRWLDGYRVVIAQVIRQYGDDRLHSPPTRNRPRCPSGPDARPVRGRPCAALPSENVRLPPPAALPGRSPWPLSLAARPAADPRVRRGPATQAFSLGLPAECRAATHPVKPSLGISTEVRRRVRFA